MKNEMPIRAAEFYVHICNYDIKMRSSICESQAYCLLFRKMGIALINVTIAEHIGSHIVPLAVTSLP